MSLLKNILSPFVEFEDDKKTPPAKVGQPTSATPPTPAPSTAPPKAPVITVQPSPTPANEYNIPVPSPSLTSVTPSATATILPEHQTYFENLIEEANSKNPIFQGTDFKEFIDSKTDIEEISDEPTRYRTAFAVLKRTGLTKERLLSTGQEYLNLIGRALNSYQSAFSQQYQKEVRGKETQLQKKAEEVQALNEKIAALKADMKQISNEINQSKQHLDANKSSFLAAGETKQTEILQELQKIEQFF